MAGAVYPQGSIKVRSGLTLKRLLRIERAAFLTTKLIFSEEEIGLQVGISKQALQYIKKTPEFKAAINTFQTGVSNAYQQETYDEAKTIKEHLDAMLPDALQAIKDVIWDKSPENRKLRYAVASEILDRTGHSKVSRISHEHSVVKHEEIKQEGEALLALLQEENQKVAEGFTLTAEQATSQNDLMEAALSEKTVTQMIQ